MPDENIYAYDHIGQLHTEGVEYVINKLNTPPFAKLTKQEIIELTAEFMFLVDCCEWDVENVNRPKGIKPSKIKYALFIEFLANLQNRYASKSMTELAKEASISVENLGVIEMIFNNATGIEASANTVDRDAETSLQMLDFLENRNNTTANDTEKRAVGVLAAVSRSSILHGLNVTRNPALTQKYESVNALALDDSSTSVPLTPDNKMKKFKWPWKADAEGGLAGFISGGIGGALGGPSVAAAGGLLGAVGGSVSNSIIKSIPWFNRDVKEKVVQ